MTQRDLFELTESRPWTDEEVVAEARAWGYRGPADAPKATEWMLNAIEWQRARSLNPSAA